MEPANPLLIGLPRALVALASRLPGRERQLRELHELCGDV